METITVNTEQEVHTKELFYAIEDTAARAAWNSSCVAQASRYHYKTLWNYAYVASQILVLGRFRNFRPIRVGRATWDRDF